MMNPKQMISTLHQALDAYRASIERNAGVETTASEYHRLSLATRLHEEHGDRSLDELGLDQCVQMIEHWRNRPVGRKGNCLSASYCANHVKELVRFFRWLDYSHASAWELPRGSEHVNRRVVSLPSDRKQLVPNDVTVEQLRLLYQRADKLDKLMMCLALNCGLNPADMGRLTANNVCPANKASILPHVPSGYAVLRSDFPQTRSYREHVLWPETLELLRWAIERTHHLGRKELFVTDHGKPMFDEKGRNPSAAITRRFRRLVDRLRITSPAFASLSLTSIRRLGLELVHRIAGCDVASLHVGHIQRPDVLMCSCEVPPFRQLHSAILEVRLRVEEMFESANDTCVPDVERLPARTHERDKHGVYTRQIGDRKFRLGTHLPTAEKRFGIISHLFQIMSDVTGDSRWTPFAQVLAGQIAAGKLTFSITKTNSSTQDNNSKGGAA
jgi:hypothetical protein